MRKAPFSSTARVRQSGNSEAQGRLAHAHFWFPRRRRVPRSGDLLLSTRQLCSDQGGHILLTPGRLASGGRLPIAVAVLIQLFLHSRGKLCPGFEPHHACRLALAQGLVGAPCSHADAARIGRTPVPREVVRAHQDSIGTGLLSLACTGHQGQGLCIVWQLFGVARHASLEDSPSLNPGTSQRSTRRS
jgi:hypothetical protein